MSKNRELLINYLHGAQQHSSRTTRALVVSTVAHSLPSEYVFTGHPSVFEIWLDVTLAALRTNLKVNFRIESTEVETQCDEAAGLIRATNWANYYPAQADWIEIAGRAQVFLALSFGMAMAGLPSEGPISDMLHAILSYLSQLASDVDNYRHKHGGTYLDDLDLTRVSMWLYSCYGRTVGYQAYDVTFPRNLTERPFKYFDVGNAAVNVGLGYWTTQVGTSGKHGGFRLFVPGWVNGQDFPQLPAFRPMPVWPEGQVIFYEKNHLKPSTFKGLDDAI
jgi:hypothetical protein